MCDITQCLYLWHHTLYVYDISTLYGIRHSVMTTQIFCNFTATILTSHPLYLCHHTQWIIFIKGSVWMISQPLSVWHQTHYMWHHIHNLGHHTTLCMTSGPLYLTSIPLYLCHHTHPIDDITATIYMTSHPVDRWHHIHYIYDIISTKYDIKTLHVDDATLSICMTYFALQMSTQTLYHTKPQYLWYHIHLSHENTAPVLDIAPTVSMSSEHDRWHLTYFCMTWHPPSGWHHMNYI